MYELYFVLMLQLKQLEAFDARNHLIALNVFPLLHHYFAVVLLLTNIQLAIATTRLYGTQLKSNGNISCSQLNAITAQIHTKSVYFNH